MNNQARILVQWNPRVSLDISGNVLKLFFSQHNVKCTLTYTFCPEGMQPCNMKNRDIYWRRYKIQDTLYIGQWLLSPLHSRHLGTSHSSPNHHQLPFRIFLKLIDGLQSLVFQRQFQFWEKPVTGHLSWGVEGLSHLGDWMFCQKNSAWDVMHEWVHWSDEAVNYPLPIAAAFWVIWIVSKEGHSSLMQNMIQICSSTRSVILNVTAMQYT